MKYLRASLALCGLLFAAAPSAVPQEPPASPASDSEFQQDFERAEKALEKNQYGEAVKYYKRANKRMQNNCSACYWGAARAYIGLGASKDAIESCDRLLKLASTDQTRAQAHNLKGVALAARAKGDRERLTEAEQEIRQAISLNPDPERFHFNLGMVLLKQGRDPEGIGELQKYVEKVGDADSGDDARWYMENPRRARENFFPSFGEVTLDGHHLSLSDLAGKVVVFDFWATWCPPCVQSVPKLRLLQRDFGKDPRFVLVSVSVDRNEDAWKEFVGRNKMEWAQILDRKGAFYRKFAGQDGLTIPTYFVVDHEGKIRYRSTGDNGITVAYVYDEVARCLKALQKAEAAAERGEDKPR